MGNKSKRTNRASRRSDGGERPIRIHLIDWRSVGLTALLLIALFGAMIAMQLAGWLDSVIGSLLSLVLCLFICVLLFDIGLLMTACMTFADGMVNAGKNAAGELMIFHAENVERLEIRDRNGVALPEDGRIYRKVELIFHMRSGRENARPLNVLTQKQLARIREALVR